MDRYCKAGVKHSVLLGGRLDTYQHISKVDLM